MKTKIQYFLLASLLFLSAFTWGAITVNSSSLPNPSFSGNYIIQRDAPIGTVIAYGPDDYIRGVLTRVCAGNVKTDFYVTIRSLKTSVGSFDKIPTYKTNVPGVGIRWYSYYSQFGDIRDPDAVLAYTGKLTAYIGMQLIKIGPITSATLTGDALASVGIV